MLVTFAPVILVSEILLAEGMVLSTYSPTAPASALLFVVVPTMPAVCDGVIAPEAESVVNAPVLAVVAPTVPLMLIEAVPVKFVTVPLEGVPSAPPFVTTAPDDPTLTTSAVATSVPRPETPVLIGRPVQLVSVPLDGVPRAPPLTSRVELAGIVVPLSVVVLLLPRVVNAPAAAVPPPIAVPSIVPPLMSAVVAV
jgi:hypothetical protein